MLKPDKILTDLAAQFKEYKGRSQIIQWIDSAIVEEHLSIEEVFHKVALDLKQLLGIKTSTVCVRTYDQLIPLFSNNADGNWPKLTTSQFQELCSKKSVFFGRIPNKVKNNTLFVLANSCFELQLVLILQDDTPTAEESILCDKETVEFIRDIASQLGVFMRTKVSKQIATAKDSLISAFFENELKPRRSWELTAENVISFLPNFRPFAIDPMPLVQILTCRTGDRYLTLRATQGDYFPCQGIGERKAVGDIIPLRVDDTICGLLVEQNADYLYVNPKIDYPQRYKAYMYGNQLPESELMIAIRHDGELIAMINIEHIAPHVFCPFHISLLRDVANFLGPFIKALCSREERLRSKEIGLLYIMTKLLKRMGQTYRHKIDNSIYKSRITIDNLLENAKEEVKVIKDKYEKRLTNLDNLLTDIQKKTQSFFEEMPDYVALKNIDVEIAINRAVAEFDPDKLKNKDGTSILRIQIPSERLQVYASLMLSEHIYNIISNSLDAISERMQERKIGRGEIEISISRFEIKDAQGKKTSPARISIKIADNGGGIPEDIYPKIGTFGFSTKQRVRGGFGLAAAHEYAQFVNGGLERVNRPSEGFIVIFHLQEYTPDIHYKQLEYKKMKGDANVTNDEDINS